MKEQGKHPSHQTKDEELGTLYENKFESNNSKDDPKSRKQKGENTRNV